MPLNKSSICPHCLNEDVSYLRIMIDKYDDNYKNLISCALYKQKSKLFKEGQIPKGVFIVHAGKLKICKELENGKEQIIHIAKEGELVGIRALFSGQKYNVTAQTLEDSHIGYLNSIDFKFLINSVSELRDNIIQELSMELVDKIEFITNLAQKNVRIRFAHALLLLAQIYDEDPINLSRDDMASFVGTATETLIRVLTEFKKEKIIEIQGRKITILEKNKLKLIASN
jgi:CRP-like cAMP-binding protein